MSEIASTPEGQAAVPAPVPAAKPARKAAARKAVATQLEAAAEWPTPAAPAAPESPVKPADPKPKAKALAPVKAAAKTASAKKPVAQKLAKKVAKKVAKQAVVKPVPASPQAKAKATKAVKAKAAPVAVEAKPTKVKLVRDSFTIPAGEYAQLAVLKQRALKAAHPAKKSELLRAGVRLLAALSDKDLLAALLAVPAIKTGRPKGKKGE